MSIFDTTIEDIDRFTNDLVKRKEEEENLAFCFGFGAKCIKVDDVKAFADKVEEVLSPSYQALNDYLRRHQGRPVIRWDVRSMRRNDAIGSLCALSKLPREPRPVVIIEHITDIPEGDLSIYDDPVRVENLLLHSWKNESTQFDEAGIGHFEIRRNDYSVLIPWSSQKADKMKLLWRPSDGLGWIE